MCGIVGYLGFRRADKVIISALKRLEYRGYDSWGIAVKSGDELKIYKKVGAIGDIRDFELCEGNIGIGHCLHPDTVVLLSDGSIKKIKDLPREVELIVYDFKRNTFVKAKGRVFKHWAKSLLRIKTNLTEILATEQHKFFVFEKEITEKPAKELKAGDLLISPQSVDVEGKNRKLKKVNCTLHYTSDKNSWKLIKRDFKNREEDTSNETQKILETNSNEISKATSNRIIPINFPEKTNPKLMRFLGYCFGNGGKDDNGLKFRNTSIEVLQEYLKLIKEIFSIEGKIGKESNWHILKVNNSLLLKWLDLNFPELMNKKFPEWIGKLTNEEILAFIGGIFDAKGFVDRKTNSLVISIDDDFAVKSIQILLLRFGILASVICPEINRKSKKQPMGLQISNKEFISAFLQKIGKYISYIKRKDIELLLNESKDRIYQHIKASIPERDFHGLEIYDGGYPALKMVTKCMNCNTDNKRLMQHLNLPIILHKILRIEKIDYNGYVYDIEVKNYQNFIANGIITHNSRWATHGKPSDVNAHPHTDCNDEIAVVHNGIISNFQRLREKLENEGHKFKSETDTEVIPHLIEKYCKKGLNLERAVMECIKILNGSYAFVAMSKNENKLIACRYKNPLILGIGDGEYFLASDVPAILEYTNKVIYLEDGDFVIVTKDGYEIYNNGIKVQRKVEVVPWSIEQAEKGGYEHFMLKEIHETPKVIEDTLLEYISEDINLDVDFAANISNIVFVACGTSYHASLVGKYLIEKLTDIPVRVEYASEFNYHDIPLTKSLVIGISQSGETADTLEALRKAKRFGARTLAITNVLGSSVTRIVDKVLYTRAGPEICVAATKSFIAQLIVLYVMALKLSTLPKSEIMEYVQELKLLPEKVRKVLDKEEEIRNVAENLANYENLLYIGRGLGYPIALEGALKMKEISYIHAEGYPAGELKHGPFALLGESTPVIACVIKDNTYGIMLSNIKEVKARNSPVIAIAEERDHEIDKFVDCSIKTPHVSSIFTPVTYSVVLQLLAYYTAKKRGCEIDKPRHLAKSVTVE